MLAWRVTCVFRPGQGTDAAQLREAWCWGGGWKRGGDGLGSGWNGEGQGTWWLRGVRRVEGYKKIFSLCPNGPLVTFNDA